MFVMPSMDDRHAGHGEYFILGVACHVISWWNLRNPMFKSGSLDDTL